MDIHFLKSIKTQSFLKKLIKEKRKKFIFTFLHFTFKNFLGRYGYSFFKIHKDPKFFEKTYKRKKLKNKIK
jgi:hypothetical protein